MGVLKNLGVGFSVNTKQLSNGVSRARKILNGVQKAALSVNGAIAAVGAGIAVHKFVEMAEAQADNVAYTNRLATQIGATTKEVSGLEYAFKKTLNRDDVEAFGDSLSDMQEKIGDVTLEEGGAKDIMRQLGLDAESMSKADAVSNFKTIADAIAGVESKAEKLHIADTMFGGEGQKMLPLLEKGSAGIEEIVKHADELGLTFNSFEAGEVVKAQQAVGELTSRFEGLANQAVVQVAPIITTLIEKVQSFGSVGITAGEVVSEGLSWVGTGLGIVADVIDVVHDGFKFLKAVASFALSWIVKGIAKVGQGFQELINLLPGVEVAFGDTLNGIADEMFRLSGEQWDSAMQDFTREPPSTAIKSFFADIADASKAARESIESVPDAIDGTTGAAMRLATAVSDLTASLKDQIATFGMSSAEAEIYKLQLQGASTAELSEARSLAAQLEGLEESKKTREEMESSAKSIFEATRTPLEQFEKKLEELQKLSDNGLIDDDTFARAAAKARNELGGTEVQFSGPMELGSNEARSTILRHQFGSQQIDPQKESVNLSKQQLKAQQETNVLLKRMAGQKPDPVLAF